MHIYLSIISEYFIYSSITLLNNANFLFGQQFFYFIFIFFLFLFFLRSYETASVINSSLSLFLKFVQ